MCNQCNAESMLYSFISPLTGAMKQHSPSKKVDGGCLYRINLREDAICH